MSIQVIEGQKDDIARKIAGIPGQVTRALVWVDESAAVGQGPKDVDAIMAELDRDTVSVGFVDDSRESLYTRMDGE